MLTIIARSIGRTVGVPNHMTRARDVLRSVKDADLTLPSSSVPASRDEVLKKFKRGDELEAMAKGIEG